MRALAIAFAAGAGFFLCALAIGEGVFRAIKDKPLDIEDDGWITLHPKV